MNSKEQPEVVFTDPQMHEIFTPEMGKFANKIMHICNDAALSEFGKEYFPNPSVVELTPYINTTDMPYPEIIVRAWHETGVKGKSAVFQKHDSALSLTFVGEDAYVVNKDSNSTYVLTTREAFLMGSFASFAAARYEHGARE